MKAWFKKYKDFFLIFILLLFSNALHNILGFNEMNILAFAKQFYNPNWIPNDFALSSPNHYQLSYNYLAGWLASFLELSLVSVLGRCLVYAVFAYSLSLLNRIIKLPSALFLLVVLVFLGNQSLIAGEWMLKGFEFKTLAYAMAFAGIYYWLTDKELKSLLVWGLAISFHVLIGTYCFLAFLLIVLFTNKVKDLLSLKILKTLPGFLVFGAVGWMAALQFLFVGGETPSEFFINYYIKFRVAHHLYPAAWNMGTFWLIPLLMTFVVTCYFFIIKCKKLKFLYLFCLSHVLFFSIGMILYSSGNLGLLKYYWFRTFDTLLPFISLISAALILQYFGNQAVKKWGILEKYKLRSSILIYVTVLLFSSSLLIKDVKKIANKEKLNYVDSRYPLMNDVFYWINDNTPKDAGVICSPYFDYFYVLAERRCFANFKTFPASPDLHEEWYNRLIFLNNGNALDLSQSFYTQWQSFENNFSQIPESSWKLVATENNFQYLLCKKWMQKDFPIVYENEAFVLYEIN